MTEQKNDDGAEEPSVEKSINDFTNIVIPMSVFVDIMHKLPSSDELENPLFEIQTSVARIRVWNGASAQQIKAILCSFEKISDCEHEELYVPKQDETQTGYS